MPTIESKAQRSTFAGLFFVALSTLMFEILLTRIFSVTMWYHFAFMAISVAMFGMTVGAILVYLRPAHFSTERVFVHLSRYSLYFGVAMVFAFLAHLQLHFQGPETLRGMLMLAATYVVISLPFVFSGVVVCLALTRFPGQVSKLYAADLAGAALGCILVIVTLRMVDGPRAVIIAGCFACLGGLCFAFGAPGRALTIGNAFFFGAFLLAALINPWLIDRGIPVFQLSWVKGALETNVIYEKWNSFSRVTVHGYPDYESPPFGWGLSPTYPPNRTIRQAYIAIDAGAGTVLTNFTGDCSKVDYLKYDITNLVHYIRPNSDVLVIGAGGGRDILSALCFEQKSVLGVEINPNILRALNKRFGEFTGHLDRRPNVKFVNDEARSYVTRSSDRSGVIQISLIDTWAATAAGAFVLTENSLYTVEAWGILMKHLRPNGVLSVSRWYTGARPEEVLRMITLARQALENLGAAGADARQRVMVVRHVVPGSKAGDPYGVGTLMVSREPFTDRDVTTLEDLAAKMKFDVVLSPHSSPDPIFAELLSGPNLQKTLDALPNNVAAPTDNIPFFFHTLRLRDLLRKELWQPGEHYKANMGAIIVLAALLGIVIVLTVVCVFLPLALTAKRVVLRGSFSLMVYFCAIGMGFMFVEISQTERLIVFLGHPVYGLAVVLFSLLLFSGLGSYLSQSLADRGPQLLIALLAVQAIFGAVTPAITHAAAGSTTPVRIALSAGILGLLGLFMGMAFPLGMKLAALRAADLAPWLWGVNGATSVCASVVAVAISLNFGIAATFWAGFACYAVALLSFSVARR